MSGDAPWWISYIWQAPVGAGWVVTYFLWKAFVREREKAGGREERLADALVQNATAITVLAERISALGGGRR